MKLLVVYYSHTGDSRVVARQLELHYDGDLYCIRETQKRSKMGVRFKGASQANREEKSQIEPVSVDPQQYDVIFLVAPIWGTMPAPALHAFIDEANLKGSKVYGFFLCRSGLGSAEEVFHQWLEDAGAELQDVYTIATSEKNAKSFLEGSQQIDDILIDLSPKLYPDDAEEFFVIKRSNK